MSAVDRVSATVADNRMRALALKVLGFNDSTPVAGTLPLVRENAAGTLRLLEENARLAAQVDALETSLVLAVGDSEHGLELYEDGDGWNEPRSEEWSCRCGVVLADWVQVDPECSGRTSPADVAGLFAAHYAEELGS